MNKFVLYFTLSSVIFLQSCGMTQYKPPENLSTFSYLNFEQDATALSYTAIFAHVHDERECQIKGGMAEYSALATLARNPLVKKVNPVNLPVSPSRNFKIAIRVADGMAFCDALIGINLEANEIYKISNASNCNVKVFKKDKAGSESLYKEIGFINYPRCT